MGKDKEKQKSFRSRQQPASSSQAAALLGGQPGEFIGFSSFSPMLDLEQHLPGEYSLCFKKMNKKDTITKVKALHEFIQLLTNTPLTTTDEHKILLQNWVSSYTKLSTDSARQVREAAQQAMGKVAGTVKKQLGPHLKTLLPFWLAARFDPSREVARAAIDALQQAIPAHKHNEALKFVGKDILTQCKEAFAQGPQAYADSKSTPEMAQERYERVTSTFMMAVSYLSETLSPEDNATFAEQYKALFLDPAFWKFLSNKSVTIRRAAYNLVPIVARLSRQLPDFDLTNLLAKDVLGLFSDKEPATHQAMWDAVLSFTTTFPQAWELQSLDVKKHVFPRLFAFLRAGTFGSLTYPSLLPFLSVVPAQQRNANFYNQFFGNMWQGFTSEGITKQGRPAAQALLLGFLECISFAASNNQTNNLPAEEKVEVETYIFQEGIWLVLNHYFQSDMLLYGDEFFVENFCKYTSKLLASPADGPNKFWKKFEETADSLLSSSPSIFCPRLAALLSGFAKSNITVPVQVQRAIFEKSAQESNPHAQHNLELATSLVSLWPLSSVISDVESYWATKLLPKFTHWLAKSEPQLTRALLGLLVAILRKSENAQANWDSLLRVLVLHFNETYEYLLAAIQQVSEKGNNAKWRSPHLESIALPLLPGGDLHALVDQRASSRILVTLISSDLIESSTLQKLGKSLISYLATNPPASPAPWGLDVIQTLVTACSSPTASESGILDLDLVTDLLVAFLEYVLRARDDAVLSAWQTCMHIGKQLETKNATQIRLRLLARLSDHVTSDTPIRYHPTVGFTPDWETWTEELVVCHAAAREIANGFSASQALDALVRKDEWVNASLGAAKALSPNYVDTHISPILQQTTNQPAEEIETFVKLSLFNLAFCRAIGLAPLLALDSYIWVAVQLEVVRMVSYADLRDAAPMWWEGAQHLRGAATETSESGTEALRAHGAAVLESSIELAQKSGGVYIFVMEIISGKLANEWNKESGLEILARFVLPQEAAVLENDTALGIVQAILPHLLPQLEHPLPAITELRAKYLQALQESPDYKRTTRSLEVLSCLFTPASLFTINEMQSVLGFFSRFSRAPLKLAEGENFAARRLDIALCKILVAIARMPEFADVAHAESWKLLKMKSIDWIKLTATDPISVLLRYQATKLFSELESIFTNSANTEKEQVKELDWPTARLEAQQAVVLQLVNARSVPPTQALNRLLSLTAHVFHTVPSNLIDPQIAKMYALFYHENTDLQKWVHHHLLSIVSAPIPETNTPTVAPEHEEVLRDSSAWVYLFEEDDPLQVHVGPKTASVSRVFGNLLAWDVLIQYLSSNSSQVRSQISSVFLREGTPAPITVLLQNIFKYIDLYSQKGKNTAYASAVSHFRVSDQVSVDGRTLGVLSGVIYTRLLQCLPGVVRLWWTDDCERKMSSFVDTYTTTHASPSIIEKELSSVNKYGTKPDSEFSVYTLPRTREVVATYKKDEMVVEIALTLSANYPLRACSVAVNQHLNVGEALWRKWLLGMTTLLLTSEGNLLDACLLWKNSLDQHFEGVEVCPICYSLFNSGQLPKLQCRTCKNKFHSACMFKWFSTSHKSTCPLCQTDFQSV
eukprot:Phypoly_transcript_00412.p1 GENE.Phypoly_transcript_00412~~Phypoly_transcript_00412.p1  ORF type:complete len:1599 (+),score=331.51 Phypoly_transcript_00412:75-4871(+)